MQRSSIFCAICKILNERLCEFILNNSMDGPLFPALFSLNMLVGTESGQAYSEQQIMDMLAEAGAKDIRRLSVETPNDSGIITGIAP